MSNPDPTPAEVIREFLCVALFGTIIFVVIFLGCSL